MELINPQYLTFPKERTFQGICESLEEAEKELKRLISKKASQEEINEKTHRVKVLELKKAKHERLKERKGKQSNGAHPPDSKVTSKKDSVILSIEKIDGEFDDSATSHIISDAISLLGDSLEVKRFLSFFQDSEDPSSAKATLIVSVLQELEKNFMFGDELLANLLVLQGSKCLSLDEFKDQAAQISLHLPEDLVVSLYSVIKNQNNQAFMPDQVKEELIQIGKVLEVTIKKVSQAQEDVLMEHILEAVGQWGTLMELTHRIRTQLVYENLLAYISEINDRKKKLSKHIANLFSTVSYNKAAAQWDIDNAAASLHEATRTVLKLTDSLIEADIHSLEILKETFDYDLEKTRKERPRGDSRKLTKFFGEEPPKLKKTDPLEYLIADEAFSQEIFFTMEGNVKGGTLERLVERLTHHSSLDEDYLFAFLLTYPSFTEPDTLLTLLIKRFELKPPDNLDPVEEDYFETKKRKPVRMRVVNVIKQWIELEPDLFRNDEALKARLVDFNMEVLKDAIPSASAQVEALLNGTLRLSRIQLGEKSRSTLTIKSSKHANILSIDPLEIAKQLTLIDFDIYRRMQPKEFFKLAWSSKTLCHLAPNVTALIRRSTHLTSYVCTKILDETDVHQRANALRHFIVVADKCRSLNNFNSLMSIYGALMSSSIHRLQRTWRLLPRKEQQIFEELRTLMSYQRNFGDYRAALKKAGRPCLPFLGLYLTDLTFIEDGNKDFLANGAFINFDKRIKAAKLIQEIQQYQQVNFDIEPVYALEELLYDLSHYEKDEEEFYSISMAVERKESESEALQRALQDTGFF